jgi:hypothetical protein
VTRPLLRRAGRGVNPAALVLAGICFALPFVTVACDIPGGYGRAAPGGTTTYTGFDLVTGGEPAVRPADRVRPLPPGHDDRLWPQPAAIAVLVLLAGAAGVSVAVAQPRLRRGGVAGLAAVAATALLVNQALVEAEVAVRVGDQLTQPLAAGRSARDYVDTGPGFVACLALLVVVAAANGFGWFRARRRAAAVEPEPTLRLAGPADP